MSLLQLIFEMDARFVGLVVMVSTLIFVECDMMVRRSGNTKLTLTQNAATERTEANCDQFFFGTSFPRLKGNQSGQVKLCQTQQHDGYVGPIVHATLFNILDRIPVYSATVKVLFPDDTGFRRPDTHYWNRVALELCDVNPDKLPDYPLSSRLGSAGSQTTDCGKFQAIERDYRGSEGILGVDRGHLNPNAINCQDEESQIATFTLTNAAPQFSKFNQIAWRQYECMTEFILLKHVPMERVYIVTGTLGQAKDKNNNPIWMNGDSPDKNPVKVPGYYWKAVCYPGNPWQNTEPWGYAVLHINSNSGERSDPRYIMKLGEFSTKYFEDALFDPICLDANLGPIQSYFDDWAEKIEYYCSSLHLKCTR